MFNKFKYKLQAFIIEDFTKRKLFSFLPDKYVVWMDYFFTFGKPPNFKNPITISEKLQWAKLYGGLEKYSNYADKYEVRKFVAKTIGKKYLIPLIGVWDKFDDINFDKLPNRFVLKATHGSAYNYICKDKTKINMPDLKKKVEGWLSENFYKKMREVQYNSIKPRIICEKYLEDESGGLIDYKIQCFNGKPFVFEVHLDRFTNHRAVFMSLKWKKLPIRMASEPSSSVGVIKKPETLSEMIKIAKRLSKSIPFVRIDLYSVKNKPYFGEMSFTPANGLFMYVPASIGKRFGKLVDINKYIKN